MTIDIHTEYRYIEREIVFSLIDRNDGKTLPEIMDDTGLSRATVRSILYDLIGEHRVGGTPGFEYVSINQ